MLSCHYISHSDGYLGSLAISAKRKSYRGQAKEGPENWKSSRDPDKDSLSREQPQSFGHRKEERLPPAPVVSQTKDPLKLQGQKLNIKLTLKVKN